MDRIGHPPPRSSTSPVGPAAERRFASDLRLNQRICSREDCSSCSNGASEPGVWHPRTSLDQSTLSPQVRTPHPDRLAPPIVRYTRRRSLSDEQFAALLDVVESSQRDTVEVQTRFSHYHHYYYPLYVHVKQCVPSLHSPSIRSTVTGNYVSIFKLLNVINIGLITSTYLVVHCCPHQLFA